ncbi:MAG: hypothetical protein ABI678_17370 [Kofleriaceae bacterium]
MRLSLLIVLAAACSPAWKQTPYDRLYQVEPVVALAPAPEKRAPDDWWNKIEYAMVRPLGQLISPATYVKAVLGGPRADDVNRFGEVIDSTWFENRAGRRAFTDDEVRVGAATDAGLAPGPLDVVAGKIDGVSPGFIVRDAAGQIWYIKFDHPAFPEVSTSAEVISSRVLWLAGYLVPSMQIGDIDLARFVLDPHATTHNHLHETVALTAKAFAQLMSNTNPDARDQIRVLYSRQLPGELLGPFSYRGRIGDDPNDTVAHEHRRSLRGLWLFSAWLNNTDTREANTLDTFREITPDHRGIVEHYLIDFGDSFGATGLGEKAAIEGWEYLVDWTAVALNLASFGMRAPPYLGLERSPFRSVGLFESKRFDPEQWKPALPNPAFYQRTREDLFWAAAIIATIQPSQIRAAVEAGHYTEEGATNYVVETLLERRRKILEFAFEGFLEVTRPRLRANILVLDDLRTLGNLGHPGAITYVVTWDRTRHADSELARGSTDSATPELAIDLTPALEAAKRIGLEDDPYITVRLSRYDTAMQVHLRVAGTRLIVVGIDR